MAVRFFMMQTHYRSTLDFSNEALQASEKGYTKLMNAIKTVENLKTSGTSTSNIRELNSNCYDAMNDDFNAPILVANLFEGVRIINSVNDGKETITANDLEVLKTTMHNFVYDVLGLKSENSNTANDKTLQSVMDVILGLRKEAKENKDFAASDKIRKELEAIGIRIKDSKEKTEWSF